MNSLWAELSQMALNKNIIEVDLTHMVEFWHKNNCKTIQ